MIQRIQSIYLLLAFLAMAACFMFPTATFTSVGSGGMEISGELNLIPKESHDAQMQAQIQSGGPVTMGQRGFVKTWPLVVLTILTAVIALVSIFLFGNRVRQVRVVAVGFLLGVVDVFLIFIWAIDSYVDGATAPFQCTEVDVTYGVGTWCPIAAVVLLFLAQRAIKKDEAMVRAADRLR